MQLLSGVLTLHFNGVGLDGTATPVAPKGLGGSTLWGCTAYKVT